MPRAPGSSSSVLDETGTRTTRDAATWKPSGRFLPGFGHEGVDAMDAMDAMDRIDAMDAMGAGSWSEQPAPD